MDSIKLRDQLGIQSLYENHNCTSAKEIFY